MIYGYVRVSTALQNVENGRFEVANFAQKQGFSVEKWVTEQISSQKKLKKRKLSVLLKKVKKGDFIQNVPPRARGGGIHKIFLPLYQKKYIFML
jgi:DNA invertase Pin-like site-specific DNA recombinase